MVKAKGEEGESLKKREREWGKSFGPEKVLCVGRERKRKKREKNRKKGTEERVKEMEVLRDFLVVEGVVSCSCC